MVGLANYQEIGFDAAPGTLQSIELKVTEGGGTIVDDTFTTLSATESFFTDDAIDLSLPGGAPVEVTLSLTGSGPGGFAAEMLVGESSSAPTCFVTGTLILTRRGLVAVEDLAVTASDGLRPIVWIGHRTLGDGGRMLPFDQQPVRVSKGAFGDSRPARDLYLSPGHLVLVDEDETGGVLVPIMCLINGTTIAREPRASATYWHVELDAHDILLAEGLPAESYLDWGDRAFFSEASNDALHDPDFIVPRFAARCRPVATTGPTIEAERRRLDMVFSVHLHKMCLWPSEEMAAPAWIS